MNKTRIAQLIRRNMAREVQLELEKNAGEIIGRMGVSVIG